MNIFSKSIIVCKEHLDELGHVNNVQYLHWIQEIASKHWYSVFPESTIGEEYWVVLEHYLQYKGPAFLSDELIVQTYIEPPEGIRLPRIVKFYKDDKVIVEGRTMWCFMDAKTNRPKRVSTEVLQLFGLDPFEK